MYMYSIPKKKVFTAREVGSAPYTLFFTTYLLHPQKVDAEAGGEAVQQVQDSPAGSVKLAVVP